MMKTNKALSPRSYDFVPAYNIIQDQKQEQEQIISLLSSYKKKLEQRIQDKTQARLNLLRSKGPLVDEFEPRDAMELTISEAVRLRQIMNNMKKCKIKPT